MRLAYGQADLAPLIDRLLARAAEDDAGAALDLATVLLSQGGGFAEEGLKLQREVLTRQRSFRITHGDGSGPRILALVAAGDFMANTPIDFLLAGSDAVLILHHVDATTGTLADLPAHDVAVMAVGESAENAPVLARLADLLRQWPGPILNNAPARIAGLTRDGTSALLAGEPAILAPQNRRIDRATLMAVAAGGAVAGGPDFPMVIRPLGTHAGHGMERIADRDDLARWLAENPAETAYAAPFIDYRGPDGLFAKQRVALIGGRPYPSHMALSQHWMVHYLNADMDRHPERRAAEARWMERFDQDFARRHAAAFAALHRRLGLDYFAIDCAEMPDGRLLVFEVDVAMIVHDMDDEIRFAYKKPAMRRLFDAFLAELGSKAALPRPSAAG